MYRNNNLEMFNRFNKKHRTWSEENGFVVIETTSSDEDSENIKTNMFHKDKYTKSNINNYGNGKHNSWKENINYSPKQQELNNNSPGGSNSTGRSCTSNKSNPSKKISSPNQNLKRKRSQTISTAPDFISLNCSSDDEIEVTPNKKQKNSGLNQPTNSRNEVFNARDVPYSRKESARLFESDPISAQIKQLFEKSKQRDSYLRNKEQLREALESAVQKTKIGGNSSKVYLVGSSVNGFSRNGSDADYCVVVDPSQETIVNRKFLMRVLRDLQRLLQRARFACRLQVIPAKVPILKFEDSISGMECDININNLTGIRNTNLMLAYSRLDPRVKPLAMCIKLWARQHQINDASQGTLSSYSLLLMTIYYLQAGVFPSVLPSLQLRHPHLFHQSLTLEHLRKNAEKVEPFRSDNQNSLNDLFKGFFKFYSNFSFQSSIISVRLGCVIKVDECTLNNHSFRNKSILIEEPFDRTNVARAVHNHSHAIVIFTKIRNTHRHLQSCRSLREIIHTAPKQIISGQNAICIDG